MAENWRDVVGYEGLYEVSDHGRVRSVARTVLFTNGGKRFYPSQVLKHGFSKGYPRVNLYKEKIPHPREIHKLILAAFIGPCPEGQEVRHYDGDKTNCTLGNLLYGTRSENYFDKYRHGRDVRGERHGMSKLTEDDVLSIRKMYGTMAYSQAQVAEFFGIDASQVSCIVNRKAWGHI
jgi:predicted XRE-type DNA-binding protein